MAFPLKHLLCKDPSDFQVIKTVGSLRTYRCGAKGTALAGRSKGHIQFIITCKVQVRQAAIQVQMLTQAEYKGSQPQYPAYFCSNNIEINSIGCALSLGRYLESMETLNSFSLLLSRTNLSETQVSPEKSKMHEGF
jgi:hypothetical protein